MCCKFGRGRGNIHAGTLLPSVSTVISNQLMSLLKYSPPRFLVPVAVCLVLMLMVWFGLADIQTKLAGLGLADITKEGEEVFNR